MNQPPQGGYPPQPQQPYPQPPGHYPHQYPQGPQAFPPQYPMGAPYPVKRGPNKGLGVLKVLVGLCAATGFGIALLVASYPGIAAGAGLGLCFAGSVFLLISGGANLAGKKTPMKAALGIALLLLVIGAAAGPPVSNAYWLSHEKNKWEELVSYDAHPSHYEWEREYFDVIPVEYHRPEAQGMLKYVYVREDIRDSNLVGLRTHVREIQAEHKDDPHYAKALETATGELKKRYDEALEKLAKPGLQPGGDESIPVDENLRTAFKEVLTDLAHAPTADIYVAFKNSSVLAAPEDHEIGLKMSAQGVKDKLKLPVMDPPKVIDHGAAFSPAYDEARRGAFIKAAGGAFANVFDANLLNFRPLEEGTNRDGKFVLEVTSHIRRTPNYFYFTNQDAAGQATSLIGFAFGIEVDWELKLFGRDGKMMYEKEQTSRPGSQLSLDTQPSDPEWAIYSILMDSAYYNYAREVVGSFGVPPPIAKTSFAYSNHGATGE